MYDCSSYMKLKTLEVHHVMACNWHVITCHYMHYMPLHAIKDANAGQATVTCQLDFTTSVARHQQTQILLYTIISGEIIGNNRL